LEYLLADHIEVPFGLELVGRGFIVSNPGAVIVTYYIYKNGLLLSKGIPSIKRDDFHQKG
jgi:hypothetical protein